MNTPLISVCIPAYNRAEVLSELLDSIFIQDFENYEVIVAEDCSPERAEIRTIIHTYSVRFPGRLTYEENPANLGYDGNIRRLIELARGEFVMFMGNDDLMCPDALSKVSSAVIRHPNVGILLRTYASFDRTPDNIVETFRYFDREIFFPAGADSITTVYRRSVVIPGMVFHRESALRCATGKFDGTLLYQLYLVTEILSVRNAVYLPETIVLYRLGGIPDFGNSASEKGKFKPKAQTPESSLCFIQGMLDIAKSAEESHDLPVYQPILRDLANYSYPLLAIQAQQPTVVFMSYCNRLARMGFWRYPMFWIYRIGIHVLGVKVLNKLNRLIKRVLGHTPTFGRVYQGSGK